MPVEGRLSALFQTPNWKVSPALPDMAMVCDIERLAPTPLNLKEQFGLRETVQSQTGWPVLAVLEDFHVTELGAVSKYGLFSKLAPEAGIVTTVTLKEALPVFPASSVAEHVTVVVPIGSVEPEAGSQETAG